VDDVGGAQVTNNAISGYAIGLCVQTPGADVRHNAVTNSCLGAFVDPGIEGAEVSHNHIFGPANPVCAGIPDLGVSGITIGGAIDTEVSNNLIEGLHTPNKTGVGIVVIDFGEPPAVATNNTIEDNVLRNNDFDIFLNTTGKGNVIQDNTCTTPADLCS
jgi:parallel beta-helix repeat protein